MKRGRTDGARNRAETADSLRRVYGLKPVLEALRARPADIECIYAADRSTSGDAAVLLDLARAARVRVQQVPRERLVAMSAGALHQGFVAELRGFEYVGIEDILARAEQRGEPALVVLLDGVQDPQNLGALIRSAEALGAHGVVIPQDRAAAVSGVVAKASAGALEHCLVARVVNLGRAMDELRDAGLWMVAADPKGDKTAWEADLGGPLGVVVGAEGAGLREGILKRCDFRLQIPLKGAVSSLNAAASGAILLYEVARQRAAGQLPA